MSIGQGVDSAFNMFQAMQRNRMARDELEYQRRQDALARADRLAEVNALAQYRADTLAQNQAQLEQRVAEFDAEAPQREQNLRLTTAQADRQELGLRSDFLTYNTDVNSNLIDGWGAQGLIDPNDFTQLNKPRLAQGILNGDKTSVDLILSQATSQLDLPVGSKAVGLDRLPNGNYVIRVQNDDGSMGVVTGPDGSNAPDAKPAQFTAERLASLAEVGYQLGTLAASKYDPMLLRQLQNKIGLDADNAEIDAALNSAAYGSQVIKSLPPEAQRPAMNVIAAAETDEERAQVTDALAQDVGLPPQAQALLEQRRQAQEKGKLGGNKKRSAARIAEIDAELAELGFSSSGVRTEAANIVAATENASADELSGAIQSGQLTVTPELTRLTADMLRGKGIEELQQLKRLKNTERSLALAVMAASTTDATTQRALLDNIDNIMETGSPSMSQKDVIDDKRADNQLEISFGNLQAAWARIAAQKTATKQQRIDNAVEAATTSVENTSKIFFSDDGSPNLSTTNAQRWSREVLPGAMRALRRATSNEEADAIMDGINQGISLALASYADDQGLSVLGWDAIAESFKNYGRSDADDTASATDFTASRVELTRDDIGNPEYFYFLDANMDRTDRAVSASDIQKVDPALYRFLLDAGRRNREAILKAREEG